MATWSRKGERSRKKPCKFGVVTRGPRKGRCRTRRPSGPKETYEGAPRKLTPGCVYMSYRAGTAYFRSVCSSNKTLDLAGKRGAALAAREDSRDVRTTVCAFGRVKGKGRVVCFRNGNRVRIPKTFTAQFARRK